MADPLSLVQRTRDALVLKALAWEPMHEFEVTRLLEGPSGGTLAVQNSALYQALHRAHDRGLATAVWGATEHNQRARYYRRTAAGRAHLAAGTARWVRYAEAVTGILTAPAPA